MTTEMDTLATALYVRVDDLLKASPPLAPWRPRVGLEPKLSDAELVTLAVMQALLGFVSEARWLRYAHAHLRYLFPYLPQQPGWNKRLRRAAELVRRILRELATDTALWTGDVWIVDSTPVGCGRSRETLADKNYYGRDFERHLADLGVRLLRPARKGEPERGGAELFKPLRQLIESVNQTLKAQLDLERHGGRTPSGVTARVLQRLLVLTAAIWHNHKTGGPIIRSLAAYDH
ncbi:IS982 family transposase [Streptomyces sp. NPDC048304]|uniref:IS982 family transposase n=1 Tax=Streptomyces sp. NPDC048304 TaxID=3154820 RepID=UPI00340B0E19